MNYRSLAAAAAAALLSLTAGCPAEETTTDTGGGGTPTVTPAIVAADAHVTADGIDSTTISVTAGTAPLTLTTTRGTFAGGEKYVVVAAVPDTVTLQSCSARTSATCAGSSTIKAVGDDGGVAQTTVTFDSVETCSNKIDDNADGLTDCADAGCSGLSCGPGTAICVGTTCNCPGAASETSCTNGIDDDCNGKTDCEEPSCNALACSSSFASYRCAGLECVDPATLYGISVTPAQPRIAAQAGATTPVEIAVTYNGAPLAGASVVLSSTSLGALSPAGPVTTDPQGRATVNFTANGGAGVQTITATYTPAGGTAVSGSGTVAVPAIGQIRLLDPNGILNPVMGVRYSGYLEQNSLTVEVLDGAGAAYPEGLSVTFEHRPLGGSTLADALAPTAACPAASCVQSATQTDADGLAHAQLYSGTVAGVVRVSSEGHRGRGLPLVRPAHHRDRRGQGQRRPPRGLLRRAGRHRDLAGARRHDVPRLQGRGPAHLRGAPKGSLRKRAGDVERRQLHVRGGLGRSSRVHAGVRPGRRRGRPGRSGLGGRLHQHPGRQAPEGRRAPRRLRGSGLRPGSP